MLARRLTLPSQAWLAASFAVVMSVWLGREALTSPRITVAAAVGLVLAAIVLKRLLVGVVLFTIITFPSSLPSSFGIATLAKPLGLLLLFSWVLLLAARRQDVSSLIRDHWVLAVGVISYMIWALLSASWATDPTATLTSGSRLVQVVVLLFIVYSVVRTPSDLRVMAWTYLLAALATSGFALATGVTSAGRITGGIVDPNFLAGEMVVALVLGGFMLAITTNWRTRLLLLGILTTCGAAFIRTQSREGVIALLIAFLLAILVAGPHRSRIVAMVLIVSALGVTYYAKLAPESLRVRITGISSQDSAGRTDIWRLAARAGARRPILGVGLGNFPVVSPRYVSSTTNLMSAQYGLNGLVVHNTYLETFSELGLVGLALLVVTLGAALAAAGRGVRRLSPSDRQTSAIARGLIVGTVALLVQYTFVSAEYEKQLWILLGLLAAIPAVVARAGEDSEEPREHGADTTHSDELRLIGSTRT
jgi:O-antigen ligase